MNNFTTDERIEQFSNLMNPYVLEEFKEWLIESGFFTAPASIHHHGAYSGALFDHSFAVTKALLSFTERLDAAPTLWVCFTIFARWTTTLARKSPPFPRCWNVTVGNITMQPFFRGMVINPL